MIFATEKVTAAIGPRAQGKSGSVAVDLWIDTARLTLIEEGVGGLKVDRLAVRLGMTRGAFYYRFEDRDHLLRCLIAHWEDDCRFLPAEAPGSSVADALAWFDRALSRLIEGDGFDFSFDLAVRAWARADRRVAWAVEREDRRRLQTLETVFEAIGYQGAEAQIRAQVFYYHQIGHHAIDWRPTLAERRRDVRTYAEILCGPGVLASA